MIKKILTKLSSKRTFLFLVLFLLVSIASVQMLGAQEPAAAANAANAAAAATGLPPENMGLPTPSVIEQLTAITALSLLPFAIMLLTSYIKIVVVLSLLRNALGVQQSPPNQVLTGIALLMTIYVMFPTVHSMYKAAETYINKAPPQQLLSAQSAQYMVQVIDISKEPMRSFLQRNTLGKHITGFYQLAYRSFPDEFKKSLKPTDFIVLIPSFITSQLKAAFEIGVLIYLPFFVIDLVTSNILLAMGMMMLSPLTIALPLKLLLLVMVDGWTLIIQGLVLSFR